LTSRMSELSLGSVVLEANSSGTSNEDGRRQPQPEREARRPRPRRSTGPSESFELHPAELSISS
jgi:hypothetical protein